MRRAEIISYLYVHMQTALKDIIGFRGSRRSQRWVNVSMEQLANRCGTLECQSISVTILVWALNEWIKRGSGPLHVTTSISWLVWKGEEINCAGGNRQNYFELTAMAQYSLLPSQIAHSAAETSYFELR